MRRHHHHSVYARWQLAESRCRAASQRVYMATAAGGQATPEQIRELAQAADEAVSLCKQYLALVSGEQSVETSDEEGRRDVEDA